MRGRECGPDSKGDQEHVEFPSDKTNDLRFECWRLGIVD